MNARRPLAAAVAAALVVAAFAGRAAEAPEEAAGEPAAASIAGVWSGAKLRCQKEESKLVRCGTPSPFAVTFDPAGTGGASDGSLPTAFTWRWAGGDEIMIAPSGGGDEIRLFGIEVDADTLTFQAYVYLPTADPDAPAESRYIHFIFDVSRKE